MRPSFKAVLGLAIALNVAGCSDYLSGPGVDQDPNNVINLNRAAPLYVGIQAAGPVQREGALARLATMYTQQVAGIARQWADLDFYGANSADVTTYWGAVYGTGNAQTGGGGLLDIHKLQQIALAGGDSLYVGISKVYEAMYVGFAADIWGDIPYREAADSTIRTPTYDPQLQIYSDLQQVLDDAIVFLSATGPTNQGPAADGSELIYAGRTSDQLRAVYTAVAHSLKARLYMHAAEADPNAYALALAQVPLGISSSADDFVWYHDQSPGAQNIWWQFENTRAGDMGPGAALVEILQRRIAAGVETNNRLAFYFSTAGGAPAADGSNFVGYRPGFTTNMPTTGGIFNGTAAAYSTPAPQFAGVDNSLSDFRQPELTYAETQLIGAEAAFRTGDAGLAQTYLNNARTNRRFGSLGGVPVSFGNAPGVLTATLENIMEEKYTTLFLNPEVWNDYKRTCLPSLAPAPTSSAPGSAPRTTAIPGRLPYGQDEAAANPNLPTTNSAGFAITSVSRNPNDPIECPALNYTSSSPLAN